MDHIPKIGNLVGYADTRLPVLVIDTNVSASTFTGYVYDSGNALIKSGLLFFRITKIYDAEEAKTFFESDTFLQSRRRRLKFGINETALRINVLKNAGLIPRDPVFELLARIHEALEQGSVIAPKR